jgi:sugar phosphate isomerase/epimerase
LAKGAAMESHRETGLEHLTLIDVAPPDFVGIAAEAGFNAVGLRISPVTPGEDAWPMSPGSPMLAETVRRCADSDVTVLDVEALLLGHSPDLARYEPIFETAAALGARHITTICEDPDLRRFSDHFSELVRMARPYRVRPVIEFMAFRPVRTLAGAVTIVQNSDGGGLLIDALHVQRCGVDLGELGDVDPALLSYLQLCDAPGRPAGKTAGSAPLPRGHAADSDAILEARSMRLLPGEGELPLLDLFAALPADIPVSVEAPCASLRGELGLTRFAARARRGLDSVLSRMEHR